MRDSRFAGAGLRWVETSSDGGIPVLLPVHQPFEPGRRFPQSRTRLHMPTDAVLAVAGPR